MRRAATPRDIPRSTTGLWWLRGRLLADVPEHASLSVRRAAQPAVPAETADPSFHPVPPAVAAPPTPLLFTRPPCRRQRAGPRDDQVRDHRFPCGPLVLGGVPRSPVASRGGWPNTRWRWAGAGARWPCSAVLSSRIAKRLAMRPSTPSNTAIRPNSAAVPPVCLGMIRVCGSKSTGRAAAGRMTTAWVPALLSACLAHGHSGRSRLS